jgi:hypothetical protein
MAKVYTSRSDEETVAVILRKGFLAQGPKWTVLRVALALSLKQPSPPSEDFDDLAGRKDGEYTLEVLTGHSQKESDAFVDAFRALLSVYHQQDLFGDGNEALFARACCSGISAAACARFKPRGGNRTTFTNSSTRNFFAAQGKDAAVPELDAAGLAQALEEFGLTAQITDSRDGPPRHSSHRTPRRSRRLRSTGA